MVYLDLYCIMYIDVVSAQIFVLESYAQSQDWLFIEMKEFW